jgi:hypothetical protein
LNSVSFLPREVPAITRIKIPFKYLLNLRKG